MQALPDHILKALKAWAMVTKDLSASNAFYGSLFKEDEAKELEMWFLDPTSILRL